MSDMNMLSGLKALLFSTTGASGKGRGATLAVPAESGTDFAQLLDAARAVGDGTPQPLPGSPAATFPDVGQDMEPGAASIGPDVSAPDPVALAGPVPQSVLPGLPASTPIDRNMSHAMAAPQPASLPADAYEVIEGGTDNVDASPDADIDAPSTLLDADGAPMTVALPQPMPQPPAPAPAPAPALALAIAEPVIPAAEQAVSGDSLTPPATQPSRRSAEGAPAPFNPADPAAMDSLATGDTPDKAQVTDDDSVAAAQPQPQPQPQSQSQSQSQSLPQPQPLSLSLSASAPMATAQPAVVSAGPAAAARPAATSAALARIAPSDSTTSISPALPITAAAAGDAIPLAPSTASPTPTADPVVAEAVSRLSPFARDAAPTVRPLPSMAAQEAGPDQPRAVDAVAFDPVALPTTSTTSTAYQAQPARADALALLQMVRDHMNGRRGQGGESGIAAANVATATSDDVAAFRPAPDQSGLSALTPAAPSATGQPQPAMTPAAMTPLSTPVDLSASLGTQVVDMGVSGQWIDSLARDIAGLSANGAQGRFHINASQLGPIQVDIRQGDDGAAVSLTVATDAAEAALRQDSDRLRLDAGLSAVRISEVKVERAAHAGDSGRSDGQQPRSGDQASSQQQSSANGQSAAWQGSGGQGAGQSQGQARWQVQENIGLTRKAGDDPAVLNHADADDTAGDAIRARYA